MSMFYSSYTIDEMDAYAQEEGGICLTREILDNWKKLRWRCREGHRFELLASSVREGGWCPECKPKEAITAPGPAEIKIAASKAGIWQKGELDYEGGRNNIGRMQKLAARKGGKCLSEKYIRSSAKLRWECKEGHIWEAKANSIISAGSWCPYCNKKGKSPLTLEKMQAVAESKGGKCLSEKYINSSVKLRWECKEGHTWEATASSVKSVGTWCPQCHGRGKPKLTLEEMRKIAESRGGKCLSEEYVRASAKLKWQCKEGHIWEASASSVKSIGTWCPPCNRRGKPKLTLAEMQTVAERKGGKCLSTEYTNAGTKLKWQCREGHIWEATASSIKNIGTWCRECIGRGRRSKDEVREDKDKGAEAVR